jgi:phospholipase/carboxylesterase|tara:strand:- start:2524 stop:3183 length:660 start_codon:yes stop_codon:yes gene_type:complete
MHVVVRFELITRTFSNNDQSNKAIIGLHGWKGDEFVFEHVANIVKIDNAQWYFPRAPYKSESGSGFTWFQGSDKRGWEYEKTISGLKDLLIKINSYGFSNKDIYLVGFSQGACLALEFTLRLPYKIGGIIPIAGFIKFKERIKSEGTKESKGTPVLLLHGNQDTIIPVSASITSHSILKERGNPVFLKTYDAGHKIPTKISSIIREFILNTNNFTLVSH